MYGTFPLVHSIWTLQCIEWQMMYSWNYTVPLSVLWWTLVTELRLSFSVFFRYYQCVHLWWTVETEKEACPVSKMCLPPWTPVTQWWHAVVKCMTYQTLSKNWAVSFGCKARLTLHLKFLSDQEDFMRSDTLQHWYWKQHTSVPFQEHVDSYCYKVWQDRWNIVYFPWTSQMWECGLQ